MSEKRAQVLILDPPVDLVFKGPFTEVVTSQLTLQNPSNEQVIFKVKTTAPKQYCVRPNSGLLQSQESATISVMLQPFEYNASDKSKHKFMVQTMYAPPGFKLESLDEVWKGASKNQLMDSKLRCVFVEQSADEPASGNAQSQVATPPADSTSNTTLGSSIKADVPSTPKQEEEVPSTATPSSNSPVQSNAGSTPAHVGPVQKETNMEKAAVESEQKDVVTDSANKGKLWGHLAKFGQKFKATSADESDEEMTVQNPLGVGAGGARAEEKMVGHQPYASDGLRQRLGPPPMLTHDEGERMPRRRQPVSPQGVGKMKPVCALVLVLVILLFAYYFMMMQ